MVDEINTKWGIVDSMPSSKLRLVFETGSNVDKLIGRLTIELMEGRGDVEMGGIGHLGRSPLKGQTFSFDQDSERLKRGTTLNKYCK